MPSSILLSSFVATSMFYIIKRSYYQTVQLQYKRLTSKRPRLSPTEFITVLTEVLEGTTSIVEEVGNAIAYEGDTSEESEQLAIEAAARADVQSQLQALEFKLLNARGLSSNDEEFEHALIYYTTIEKTAEIMMLSMMCLISPTT
jgi:hypothetical protein